MSATLRAILISALCSLVCVANGNADDTISAGARCVRIVSLAPSIDEVVSRLGLESQLVGVTRFSLYPEAAKSIPRVGGFLDVNREAVLALRPSLVLALTEHGDLIQNLKDLGLHVLVVSHKSVRGILHSIKDIAETCGIADRGTAVVKDLAKKVEAVEKLSGVPPMRVLVALGDDSGEGPHRAVYVSGSDGYYTQLLRILGAENVHVGTTMSVPSLSAEGLIALNPDVVLVVSSSRLSHMERERVLHSWQQVPGLRAGKANAVHVLDQDFMTIPGPRYVEALRAMSEVLRGVAPREGSE